MSRRRLFIVPFFLVALLAVAATPAQAQFDCGRDCKSCGFMRYEGFNYSAFGEYDMDCSWHSTTCENGICGPQSVSDQAPVAVEIAKIVRSLGPTHLAAAMERYGDRLLLNRSRNLLVVLGTQCNSRALQDVIFLSPDNAEVFASLGIRSLEEFLASEPPPLEAVSSLP